MSDSASDRAEVRELARDMVIAAMSTGAGVPRGQNMREVVRAARTFHSELDKPTEKPRSKPATETLPSDPEDDGAEMIAEDELAEP